MKKAMTVFVSCALAVSVTACNYEKETVKDLTQGNVSLEVVTTFAGTDGNSSVYKVNCQKWEEMTGNTVSDMSAVADDTFKARVVKDFETGSEPDVLFFYSGVDASAFVEAGKVVSLAEIKREYPHYGANLDVKQMVASPVDRTIYALPVNAYWEGLFVNRSVLEAAGVEVPGADYTWEQFIIDCEAIKNAGFIPVAAALGDIPNYWWEYAIFNHTGPTWHLLIPDSIEDEVGRAWVSGMKDIKALYESGIFPENTNTMRDDETLNMFIDGEAAFLLDGSWRVNAIVQACQSDPGNPDTLDEEKLDNFTVTYAPAYDKRSATDIIGGMSMGYYITRKAWNNLEKREAAISFVTYMTSNEVVPQFSEHTDNALRAQNKLDESLLNSLQVKAVRMLEGVTSQTSALQDFFDGEFRNPTFAGLPKILTGVKEPEQAVQEGINLYKYAMIR